ncbi:hypothetical protein [Azospirillum sp. Sh1]|uniref:phage head spike fiber domain-containing protein n=1 Tax=Azospirillum sp. Sh1 TaxID=2607285 RepID=UPI0011ED1BEB|nr:hypothetical protein [Azospirillum sp. Sh1]KAA0576670.1 hypothetical protein FZ029_12445 [Azospirillum sp. Sh1]
MIISQLVQDAIARLKQYNLGLYNSASNKFGLSGVGGMAANWSRHSKDVATVGECVASLVEQVDTATSLVLPAVPIVTAARDQAVAAANTAAGIIQHVQPYEIAGIPPIIDFPFSGAAAVPAGVVAGSSGKWVTNQAGALTFIPAGTAPIEFDPITAALQGLRVEEARSTLVVKSRRLDDAAWTKSGITTGAIAGADGVLAAATRLTASSANGTCIQASSSASAARRFAPFVRRAAGTGTVQMTLDGGSTWTTITPTSSYVRYGMGQTVANPTVGFRLGSSGDQIDVDFAGGETGTFDTSPIEAGSSIVTRAADVNTLLLSSVPGWSTSEGTIYVEFDTTSNTVITKYPISLNSGSGYSERIDIELGGTNQRSALIVSGGATQAYFIGANVSTATLCKAAVAFKANDFAFSYDGGSASTDPAGTAPTVTRVELGSVMGGNHLNGHIRRLTIFPRRLSNATLPLLTA